MDRIQLFFNSSIGLRQGCRLAPLIFIFVMEVFSCALSQDHLNGILKGISVGGISILAIYFTNTLNSTWSTYEMGGSWEQTILKLLIILKSTANLSTTVFLDRDWFISSNFLWSNLHLTNKYWYSTWDKSLPYSSQKEGKPLWKSDTNDL